MRIYGDQLSGNCLKVKWTADLLGLSYEWIETSAFGQSRTPEFLAMHPAGQVPVVRFDDGRVLAQSNAIMRYLARGSRLLPEDPFEQARVDEWLFWEQNGHEPFVAVVRFQVLAQKQTAETLEPRLVSRGNAALDHLETVLTGRNFLLNAPTIADLACVAYTRVAEEGLFDLGPRPAVRAWIARCEAELGVSGGRVR
jgi:glutathione S-transferase